MRMLMMTVAAVVLAGCGDGGILPGDDAGLVAGQPILIKSDNVNGKNSLSSFENGDRGVIATSGFVRPAPNGAVSTAGYVNLQAVGDDALIGAEAPGFAVVELHEVTERDGVSRMRRVDRIALPDGEPVHLRPGGYHLMMMGPTKVLRSRDVLPVTLTFESGAALSLDLPVSRDGPDVRSGMDHSGH